MDEGDLDDYVKEKMFLEEYEASFVLKQLIEAIDHLNKLSLIHRDLKPENIMVQCILLRFGRGRMLISLRKSK